MEFLSKRPKFVTEFDGDLSPGLNRSYWAFINKFQTIESQGVFWFPFRQAAACRQRRGAVRVIKMYCN
jgi:hypothetical protein